MIQENNRERKEENERETDHLSFNLLIHLPITMNSHLFYPNSHPFLSKKVNIIFRYMGKDERKKKMEDITEEEEEGTPPVKMYNNTI